MEDDKHRPRKQRHTAKRIFEPLRAEHGYTGGYTIVKDYVRAAKLCGREMFIPLTHAPGQDFLHAVFLVQVPLADKLDFDTGLDRLPLRVLAQLIAERLGEARVVEDPHLPLIQIRGHSPGVADLRQRAKNQHPVPAAQHSRYLCGIPFGQQFDVHSTSYPTASLVPATPG